MHADLDDGIMEIDSIAIKKTNLKKRESERELKGLLGQNQMYQH